MSYYHPYKPVVVYNNMEFAKMLVTCFSADELCDVLPKTQNS